MTRMEISSAKNADLRASMAAIQRAAKQARQIAIQTNTAIVIVRGGKPVRISADDLRKQSAEEKAG